MPVEELQQLQPESTDPTFTTEIPPAKTTGEISDVPMPDNPIYNQGKALEGRGERLEKIVDKGLKVKGYGEDYTPFFSELEFLAAKITDSINIPEQLKRAGRFLQRAGDPYDSNFFGQGEPGLRFIQRDLLPEAKEALTDVAGWVNPSMPAGAGIVKGWNSQLVNFLMKEERPRKAFEWAQLMQGAVKKPGTFTAEELELSKLAPWIEQKVAENPNQKLSNTDLLEVFRQNETEFRTRVFPKEVGKTTISDPTLNKLVGDLEGVGLKLKTVQDKALDAYQVLDRLYGRGIGWIAIDITTNAARYAERLNTDYEEALRNILNNYKGDSWEGWFKSAEDGVNAIKNLRAKYPDFREEFDNYVKSKVEERLLRKEKDDIQKQIHQYVPTLPGFENYAEPIRSDYGEIYSDESIDSFVDALRRGIIDEGGNSIDVDTDSISWFGRTLNLPRKPEETLEGNNYKEYVIRQVGEKGEDWSTGHFPEDKGLWGWFRGEERTLDKAGDRAFVVVEMQPERTQMGNAFAWKREYLPKIDKLDEIVRRVRQRPELKDEEVIKLAEELSGIVPKVLKVDQYNGNLRVRTGPKDDLQDLFFDKPANVLPFLRNYIWDKLIPDAPFKKEDNYFLVKSFLKQAKEEGRTKIAFPASVDVIGEIEKWQKDETIKVAGKHLSQAYDEGVFDKEALSKVVVKPKERDWFDLALNSGKDVHTTDNILIGELFKLIEDKGIDAIKPFLKDPSTPVEHTLNWKMPRAKQLQPFYEKELPKFLQQFGEVSKDTVEGKFPMYVLDISSPKAQKMIDNMTDYGKVLEQPYTSAGAMAARSSAELTEKWKSKFLGTDPTKVPIFRAAVRLNGEVNLGPIERGAGGDYLSVHSKAKGWGEQGAEEGYKCPDGKFRTRIQMIPYLEREFGLVLTDPDAGMWRGGLERFTAEAVEDVLRKGKVREDIKEVGIKVKDADTGREYAEGGIVDIRDKLYGGEEEYFRKHPEVSGMAAEDSKVILNPYSNLSPEERAAVYRNEAARIHMRRNESPSFELTEEQARNLDSTSYRNLPEQNRRETIAARIYSGDPSGGTPTEEQRKFVENLYKKLDFNPEGSGYDYSTAIREGLSRDSTGHWPSRAPISGQILKGRGHPTYGLTEQGEAAADYAIQTRADGRGYSAPAFQRLDPGVYQDDAGNIFQVTKEGQLQPLGGSKFSASGLMSQ